MHCTYYSICMSLKDTISGSDAKSGKVVRIPNGDGVFTIGSVKQKSCDNFSRVQVNSNGLF